MSVPDAFLSAALTHHRIWIRTNLIRPQDLIISSTGNISCEPFDRAWENHWILDLYGCSANGEAQVLHYNATRNEESANDELGMTNKRLLIIKIVVPIVAALFWAALVWCLCARRRKKKKIAKEYQDEKAKNASEGNGVEEQKIFAVGSKPQSMEATVTKAGSSPDRPTELPSRLQHIDEMGGETRSCAMAGNSRTSELDAFERKETELDATEKRVAELGDNRGLNRL